MINYGIYDTTPEIPSEDLEQIRVASFQDTIGGLKGVQTIQAELFLDETSPVEDAVSRFLMYERGATSSASLYVEPNIAEIQSDEEVTFSPRVARAGKNSAHGVFFGDIKFGVDNSLAVAVKPHDSDNNMKSALVDHFNGRAVRNLGIHSLRPIGVILSSEGISYSITQLDETLTTLDSIDWSNFYPNYLKHPGMSQIWSQVARQVAFLHSLGSTNHGDLAGRNIATTADNYVFPIDWEKAHISLERPRDAEVRYSYSHSDLAMLLETFVRSPSDGFKSGLGIFYGKDGDWWDGFSQIFLDEYIAMRTELAEATNDKTIVDDVKNELEVLLASLRMDIEAMREYTEVSRKK